MIYSVLNDKITVYDTSQFNIEQILNSGQIFRYSGDGKNFKIIAKNTICHLKYDMGSVIIKSSNVDFAVNFFDLCKDYGPIKQKLRENNFLDRAISFGEGIRILKQDPLETIISFIISANNNIPRIKGILNRLCEYLGEDLGEEDKAFPTLDALASENTDFYKKIGAGYRAEYIVKTVAMIKSGFNLDLYRTDTAEARKELMRLYGVGNKVADCILLFAYNKGDVFPVDTWCKRIYRDMGLPESQSCKHMSNALSDIFGENSGIAQQYLYYYYRENKII